MRTAQARQIKYLDLARLDFAPAAPVRVVDINSECTGDVTAKLAAYSAASNFEQVRAMFEIADSDGGFTDLAGRHGATLANLIQRVADYPVAMGILK